MLRIVGYHREKDSSLPLVWAVCEREPYVKFSLLGPSTAVSRLSADPLARCELVQYVLGD